MRVIAPEGEIKHRHEQETVTRGMASLSRRPISLPRHRGGRGIDLFAGALAKAEGEGK
jgi:hypothetical protein